VEAVDVGGVGIDQVGKSNPKPERECAMEKIACDRLSRSDILRATKLDLACDPSFDQGVMVLYCHSPAASASQIAAMINQANLRRYRKTTPIDQQMSPRPATAARRSGIIGELIIEPENRQLA
jgi:hypothetical protein